MSIWLNNNIKAWVELIPMLYDDVVISFCEVVHRKTDKKMDCKKKQKTIQSENYIFEYFLRINSILFIHINWDKG